MKIFVIGLPKSGRSTVAKSLGEEGYSYIDATGWIRSTFRSPKDGEHPHQFEDEYHHYLSKRLLINPHFIVDHVHDMMKMSTNSIIVIDGVFSPQDFISLFDYRQDVVVFLNRTNNEHEYRDHENIGTSVIRDYCFWMSSVGLISKNRWLEFNFKIPGESSDHVKTMGARNTVFVVKSIDRVIPLLKEKIKEIIDAIPH